MNASVKELSRRCFLTGVSSMMVSRAIAKEADAKCYTLDDQQPFRGQTRRLKIRCGNTPVASLIFPTDYPTHFRLKPELQNVCTPTGIPVTGSHEYSFIHHQLIMCGHGKVQVDGDERIVDFYRQLPFPFPGRRDPFRSPDTKKNLFQLGPSGIQRVNEARWRSTNQVVIQLKLAWQTREIDRDEGDTLALEERLYRITSHAQATIVDVFSRLESAGRELNLLPENDHGYLGVRVHDLIDVEDGGLLRDSEGRSNAIEHFRDVTGQRRIPQWVDCTGKIGNATVGMALMSHPENVRNQWYVREYGLIILSAAQTTAVRIVAGNPFNFAARFVAHDGHLLSETANQIYVDFAATRADQLREFVEG